VPPWATAPALFYVACLMARGLTEVEWDDVTEAGAGDGDGSHHALHLLDRRRNCLRIHQLRRDQAGGRPMEGYPPRVAILAVLFVVKFVVIG
jgi:AGZA family xanthine/uracil permease-like MFS transporter